MTEGQSEPTDEQVLAAFRAQPRVRLSPSQTEPTSARCTGASNCPATEHIFGCYAGPGWRDEVLARLDAEPRCCHCNHVHTVHQRGSCCWCCSQGHFLSIEDFRKARGEETP